MPYKVGDRVVIKSWEGMVDEFGISDDLVEIPCKCHFVTSMKEYCETVMTIRDARMSGGQGAYKMEEDYGYWNYSDDMILGLAGVSDDDILGDFITTTTLL